MGILIPRDLRRNKTSTAVWLASKRRDFIRNGGVAGLGPELQPNFDMSQGAAGWSAVDSTVQAVTDGGQPAVLITSLINGPGRGNLSIPELYAGKNIRISVIARRGAGTTQSIRSFTYCTIPNTPVVPGGYKEYIFDTVATLSSGESRLFSSTGSGLIGDELYVRQVSIREFL